MKRLTTDQIIDRKISLFESLAVTTEMLVSSLLRSGVDLTQWHSEVAEIKRILSEKEALSAMIEHESHSPFTNSL